MPALLLIVPYCVNAHETPSYGIQRELPERRSLLKP
jgi:hypothetical protein